MTLSPNFALYGRDLSRVFVSGLEGSGLNTTVRLGSSLPLFCFEGNPARPDYASFDQTTATLEMQLCPAAQILAGQVVVVTFNFTNPTARQASPDIDIRAMGTYVFLSSRMVKSGAEWNRVARGHDPLMVVAILKWSSSSVTRAPCKGGATIVLSGKAFPSSFGVAILPYNCSFELNGVYSLTETVVNGSTIICASPFSEQQYVMNFQLRYNGRLLDFGVPTALTHDDFLFATSDAAPYPFNVDDGWESIALGSPLQGPADGGTVISIVGYGFNWRTGFKCQFVSSNQTEDSAAVVRSQTLLTCATPVWGLHHAAATTALKILRVDGLGQEDFILFTNGTVKEVDANACQYFPQYGRCAFTFHHVWTMTGNTATLDLAPSQPTVFSAAGGQDLMVRGMGFDPQRDYACRFMFRYGPFTYGPFVSPRVARFVNHTLIMCTTPVWKYYYTQEAAMELIASGQDAPVQLATREQHVAFTFEEVYYSLEPSMGSAAGGYRVTVRGFGFDQAKGYRVRLGGHPHDGLPTQVLSFSEISFVLPKQVGSHSSANVTLQYANMNPIRQGEFVRLLPDHHPAPDNNSWSGQHGGCATYAYGQPNWNLCAEHGACAACATTCASECGFFDGEDGLYLPFALFPQWIRVDSPIMDPSFKSVVIVETYGVGPPHNYFCAYPDGPLAACTQTGTEPYLSCPSPVDAYGLGLRHAELRIYQGADAGSAVRIQSPADPNITLVHINRPPVFHLSTAWIDTHHENSGTYNETVAIGISKGDRDGSPDPLESGQSLTFSVSYAPEVLFDIAPQVSAAGRLSFRIKDNRNGMARIWITLHDDGGTEYGGVDVSETRVVNLNVRSQVRAPQLILVPNPVQILEGGGGRVIHGFVDIELHLQTHALQSLEIVVQPRSPADAFYFVRTPRVLFNGDLEFELKEYVFGTADFTMAFLGADGASGSSVTVSKNLTLEITSVNQAPSFTLPMTTVAINESRAWVYGVLEFQDVIRSILPRDSVPPNDSARGEDWGERTQNVSFHITVLVQNADIVRVDEPELAPRVALHGAYPLTQGTLLLVTRPNANGQVVLNFIAVDTANGSSAEQQLTINISPVNDAPRIDSNCSVSSRISCQLACARYPYDVPAVGTSSSPLVFLEARAAQGESNSCMNASSMVRVTVDENCANCPDDGHVGGLDAQQCLGRRFSVAGLFQSSPSIWDSSDELGQSLTFIVSLIGTHVHGDTGYDSLFHTAPQVRQADGRLTFCLKEDANGNATFSVVVMDSGGDERGGIATSHPTLLVIDVAPVNQAPLFSVPGPLFTLCAGTGNQTLQGFAGTISKGNKGENVADREASQHATFHVALGLHDPGIFSSSLTIDQQGTLRVELARYQVGTAQSNITLHDDGGVYGGGRDVSVDKPLLMAVVDSVLAVKMSIQDIDINWPVEQLQHEVAEIVSSMLSLGRDWIHVGVIDRNITAKDLVCGPCRNDVHISGFCGNVDISNPSRGSARCLDGSVSPLISRAANAASFYVRVLLSDLNYTWADLITNGHVPAPWKVDWVQHMLHSNCANKPSFDVGGEDLARSDGPVNVTCSGTCPCGGSHGPSSGSISDGPGNYGNSQTCSWLVASSYPANIMIAFSSFDTESGKDFVTINECSSASCATRRQLAMLSGSAVSASTVYTASTGFLEVVFSTDDSGTGAGFEASVGTMLNKTAVFYETDTLASLTMPNFLTSVVAPQDVTINSHGRENVTFVVEPVAHKLFGRKHWTVDGTDGGLMQSTPSIVPTFNSTQVTDFRFRASGECREADLLIQPKRFWNGRVIYRLSMLGWSESALFELELLPVNQIPSFSLEEIVVVDEDSGSVSLPSTAVNVVAGPAVEDEGNQILTFELHLIEGGSDVVDLSTMSLKIVNDTATLQFSTIPNGNGVLVFNVSLHDYDVLRNDNKTSLSVRMRLEVLPVNDAPVVALNCSSIEPSTYSMLPIGSGAWWEDVANLTCGGTNCGSGCTPSSGASGTISDGAGNYSNNANCWWLLATSPGVEIRISFPEFETEGGRDDVTIYACDSVSCSSQTELLKHSGSLDAGNVYTSTTGFLKVAFTSDGSVTLSGFTGTWSVPAGLRTCSGSLEVSEGCRDFGSGPCAMLIHVDENCDDCVAKEKPEAGGSGTCFVAQHILRSRPSLHRRADEENQTLSFAVELLSGVDMLVPQGLKFVVVPEDDSVKICLAEDMNGRATYRIIAADDGGRWHSGQNESVATILQLKVHPVNQAPSFLVCCDSMITLWTGGVQVLDSFARRILKGRPNADGSDREGFQQATFHVVAGVGTDKLFTAEPSVDSNGALTASLLPAVPGMFNFTVFLVDDAGTYGKGRNTSDLHNVSLAVVDSYVAIRISLDPKGLQVTLPQMEMHARKEVLRVLQVPYDHWVAMCGNNLLFNDTICQDESAHAAFANEDCTYCSDGVCPNSLNSLALSTIYVVSPSAQKAVEYSLKAQDIGQALRTHVTRSLKVEALPIRRNWQQNPHFDINNLALQDILEVDLDKWSPRGSNSSIVRHGFLVNVSAPQHVPYTLKAQEHLVFAIRPLGHRLFSRDTWTMDGTDGGLMVLPPNVTADCRPLCHEATLTVAPKEFWNGKVLYEIHLMTTHVKKQVIIFVEPVNQEPRLTVTSLIYLLEDEVSLVSPAACAIIAGPPVEDEQAQHMDAYVLAPDTAQILGAARVSEQGACVDISVSLNGSQVTGNTSVQVVVSDSGTYQVAGTLPPGRYFPSYQGSVTCSGTCPCGGSHGPSSGSISDGPGNYGNSQTCSWLVASSYPANIMIAFSSFDTESGKDFVTINECSSASCATRRQLAMLSGSAVNASTVYTASTGFLEVVFSTDDSGTGAGFEAAWTLGDQAKSTPLQLPVHTVRINASVTVQENSDCTTDTGCVHPNFASDIVGQEAGGQQITYTATKMAGESVDKIDLLANGTLIIYSVFDKIGVTYFRIGLHANGSFPTAFVDRTTAIDVSYVNQAPRFTLITNGSALLVNEKEPVPLADDQEFDAGYGGCHTYSFSYQPTEQDPANSGFCVQDHACLACAASCAEECGTLGGLLTVIVGARNILSGAPHIDQEEVQNITFSVVRLEASAYILAQCNFEYPADIHAQDDMDAGKMLLQGDPYFNADGKLHFHITPYRFGIVPFNVTLTDDLNLSTTKLMCFSVMPVNQPPTFSLRHNVVHVAESFHGGVVACNACVNIARDIDAGPLEQHQALSFVLTAVEARIPSRPDVAWETVNTTQVLGSSGQDDIQLFESLSSVSIDQQGTLSFRLRAKRYGKVRFEVALRDSGGIERGGVDSVVYMLTLDVMPVNDAPTFVLIAPQFYFSEQTAEQSISKIEIGSQVSRGAWAESTQTLSFRVERVSGPPGVISQPSASLGSPDALGSRVLLEIKIAPHRYGNVTLNVTVLDDGGRDRRGQDNTTYSVVIVVKSANNAPTLLLASNELLVNLNSRCSGPDIYGGRRTRVVNGQVACSAAWENPGSAAARLQDLGASTCNGQGPALEHEHLGFLSRFSVGIFEDGANGCPNRAVRAECCIDVCVNRSAPDFLGYPACGCEAQAGLFNVISLDPLAESAIFQEAPRFLFPCGVLYFKLKQLASGKVAYNVSLSDGVAASASSMFSIRVLKVNIAPYFDWSIIPPYIEVLEDSGEQSLPMAQNVSADASQGTREPEQSVTFMLTPSFSDLFDALGQPRISHVGQLVFLPAADEFGNQTYTVTLVDDGGTERGGIDSFQRQLSIAVISVNDAPYFTLQPFVEILESSGVNVLAGFAPLVSPGAASEAAVQQISFTIDYVSAPELFSRALSISPNGTLTLVPAKSASGYALVDVRLVDNGDHGGPRGDNCTSATQTFTVSVKAVNDAPGFTIPWKVTCDTTEYLGAGVCQCPLVASVVEQQTTPPVACVLHNSTQLGLPYLCPTPANAEKECIFAGRAGVIKEFTETIVSVLEDSGQHHMVGFVHDVSPEAGRAGGSMTRFYQTTWDQEIEMVQGFREDVLGQPGLEYAHTYAHSADGKYVYAVERELNTLAVFEQLGESLSWDTDGAAGGNRLGPVDRLAEGQDRVRFTHNPSFSMSSEAVCGLTEVWIGEHQHIVAASGCQLLRDYVGVVSNRSCLTAACNSTCCHDLHQGLVGHWEMSVDFLYGKHRVNALSPGDSSQRMDFSNDMYWQYMRNPITVSGPPGSSGIQPVCAETQNTQVGPATIRDLSAMETLGAAIFRGAGLFCKSDDAAKRRYLKDWDVETDKALSAANFIMSNGELEAMQFDGKLNLGLLVAEDVNDDPVNRSIPSAAFSVDVWFMLDEDAASGERGLIAAFLPGFLEAEDECMGGWRLSYKAQASSVASLETVFTFELVANNNISATSVNHTNTTNQTNATDTNTTEPEPEPEPEPESIAVLRTTSPSLSLTAGGWYHVLAVSDMHELKIYLNGKLLNASKRVTCATCQGPVYRRDYHPQCRGEKTPLTIGTFCASPEVRVIDRDLLQGDASRAACAMDSDHWSHHSGAIFSARVWDREINAAEAAKLYDMHAARLTPVDTANYWVVGREQDLWRIKDPVSGAPVVPSVKGSSPSNGTVLGQKWCDTMPVAPASMLEQSSTPPSASIADRARLTLRGKFARGQTYTVQFRDYKNVTLKKSTEARRRLNPDGSPAPSDGATGITELAFDLAGSVWPNGYSSTIISLVGPNGLPVWQRVCLKTSCGLPAAGTADRKNALHPGLQGSRLRFSFITDSRALKVTNNQEGVSFTRMESMFPPVQDGGEQQSVFLGAASSTFLLIDGVNYLAVANFWDGESHEVPSRLLRLDTPSPQGAPPQEPRFQQVQTLVSKGARQWALVDVSQIGLQFSTVLALANYLEPSVLIPWEGNRTEPPLDLANSVVLGSALGTSAVKVFYVNGWPYLVLAVFADPTANSTRNLSVRSSIVRLGKTLNDTHAHFGHETGRYAAAEASTAPASGLGIAVTQELETAGAHDVEVFRANDRLYLFFAVDLAEHESLLYMSEGGGGEPHFILLQRVMVHGHATSVRAFVVEAPPAEFGATVAAAFRAAHPVHVVVGRSSGQALVLRFNGTHLLSVPDAQTLPLDWAGGQKAGVNDARSKTLAVLPLSPGRDGSVNTSHVVLGQYEVSWVQDSAPYSPSQVLKRTRVGVRGLEAPTSVLEVESGDRTFVVVASLVHERLSIFERNTSQAGEVLVFSSLSGLCGQVVPFPQRRDDYPEDQPQSAGWSMLAQGWPGMKGGPCVFATSPFRGAIAAFCFDQSSVLQCVDIMLDGEEAEGGHPKRLVDGLAGAVALAVSSDNSSIYVAGAYDHAVAVVQWTNQSAFEFMDRLKQGERLIHSFRSDIDDTVPFQGDTPEGFFKVQLPLELSRYQTAVIPSGYPQAGSLVTFALLPTAYPGGTAYVALPPPAPLEYPARLGGNQRNWSLNARDTEHWTLKDGSRYMAIASSDPGADPDGLAVVVVLRWNEDGKRFDVIQHLGVHDMAPSALCSFEVADVTGVAWRYLAVGSSLRHGDHRASINVYRWDHAAMKFVFHHGAPATVGGQLNDPLTGERLAAKLNVEKLVHWEVDGQHYLAAAVSRVVFTVGYQEEQMTVTCQNRSGVDRCISNVSLQCEAWDRNANATRNVTRYDWQRLGLAHSIRNCTTTGVPRVCRTESRTEDRKMSTGFRPRTVSSYPFDVRFCVTGNDTRCATNITGPRTSPIGNCTHVNMNRCTDEDPYVVCTPHFKWMTNVHTSEKAYVYRWNNYGSVVLEDGKIGHGMGLQVFQMLDAPRTIDVATRLLDHGNTKQRLVMFASFGHSGIDGNVLVFRFDRGIYNPYMRGQMGLLALLQSVPCDHPTALDLHTIADERFGLRGTLMAVATSTAPVSSTAAQASAWPSYTPSLLFYKWNIENGNFESHVVREKEEALRPRGAMGLRFFEDSGELYIAVAQGVCFVGQHDDNFDPHACEQDVLPGEMPGQPSSRVLQFDRVEQDFGEVLALIDASNVALHGLNVPNDEIREHQQPLRIAAGRNRDWEVIVVDGRTLLVAASETRGTLVYEFDFEHVVGLAGVSAIASNGTTYEEGQPLERIFAASRDDGAVLRILHIKSPPSNPLHPSASVTGSLRFDWKAILSTTPLTVRRDLMTRGGGGVIGLEAPGGIRVRCEQRQVKVAHRDFRDQGICFIDVRSVADRAELPCGTFAPNPAPTSFVRERLQEDAQLVLERDPVCQPVRFALQQVESTNALLFEENGMPEIAPNGTLSFRLRDMQYGVSRQRIVLLDAGGRESFERFVRIQVLTVNHPPFFTLNDIYGGQDNVMGDQVLVFAPMVSPGARHEAHQNLTWRFRFTNEHNFERPPKLDVVRAGKNPLELIGVVTFRIKDSVPFVSEFRVILIDNGPNATADGSISTSAEGSFKLTIIANNVPPKVLTISPQSGSPMPEVSGVLHDSANKDAPPLPPVVYTGEDQGRVSLSLAFDKGYAREASQRVHFELVGVEKLLSPFSADRLFKSFNVTIPPSGVIVSPAELAFETAKGYNGRFLIKMLIVDDGGNEHFGNDRTLFSFVLSVRPQFSFPAVAKIRDIQVLEAHESVKIVREGILGNFSAMPDDESLRPLTLEIVSNDNPWLFSEGPKFSVDGSVAFTLAPKRSGTANFVVAFKNDIGSLAPSGMWVRVVVRVVEINSAPTAKVLPEIAVVEQDTLLEHQLVGAIYDVLPGPFFDEWNSQKVSFRVSFITSSTSLFALPPAVRSDYSVKRRHGRDDLPMLPPHNLTLTTSPNVHGVAELSLVPYDDGGVSHGGLDVGETLRTTIKVYPRPRVRSVHPRVGSLWGAVAVTIHGESFGSTYSRGYWIGTGAGTKYGNVSVLFGDAACENVEVVSDSELRCTAPPGRGCTNVSVTILDGSLTRTGHLACGYVYTEIIFGGVQQEGQGILALGPEHNQSMTQPHGNSSPTNRRESATGSSPWVPSALLDSLHLSKSVLALQVRSDLQLFVGGTFLSVGGVKVNHIARYDWSQVHKLGNGVDGAVHALVLQQSGDLVAAGVFTKAFLGKGGAVATGGLAVWDGSMWSPLGCAVSGSYFAAAVNGSLLYVAGRIKDTCGIPTNGIALWDSYRWRALGSGLAKGTVHAIALHHDFVYAGGSFMEAGGREVSRVARWDGADWHPLGFLNGDVHSLAVFGEYLFAGGDFTLAGSSPCKHLARFYSGDWVQVGGGVNGPILSLQPLHSCLYFGGSFSQIYPEGGGSNSSSGVARWCVDEQTFEAVAPSGLHHLTSVRAMALPPLRGHCSAAVAVC
jgi:hypothetical protein